MTHCHTRRRVGQRGDRVARRGDDARGTVHAERQEARVRVGELLTVEDELVESPRADPR